MIFFFLYTYILWYSSRMLNYVCTEIVRAIFFYNIIRDALLKLNLWGTRSCSLSDARVKILEQNAKGWFSFANHCYSYFLWLWTWGMHVRQELHKTNCSVSDILWQNTDWGEVKPVSFLTILFPCHLLSTPESPPPPSLYLPLSLSFNLAYIIQCWGCHTN